MRGEKVLVVDDSPTELMAVTAALQARGFRTVTAADGEEALRMAVSERPRVIVLDVIMPKKNGYQVCRQLKAGEETKDIPVLLLTSKGQECDRFWGLKQGADEYLTKPFAADELASAVARHAS